MTFGFYWIPNLFDFPVWANQERAANNSLVGLAHELLGAPSAIRFDHLVSRIAEQRKIQFLFGLETLQQFHGIRAGAENDHAALVKFRFCVTKLGRLDRSTRSICFRKEKDKDALPLEIAQGDFLPSIGTQGKVRSFVSDFQHRAATSRVNCKPPAQNVRLFLPCIPFARTSPAIPRLRRRILRR